MGFLSELSLVQRAGGAAVLVLLLVLLLVKQRQAKAAPAGGKATAAKAEKTPKAKKAPKAAKVKSSRGLGRGRKGKKDAEETVAEPKATSGRMVPRLPAAGQEPQAFEPAPEVHEAAVVEPAFAEAVAPAGPSDMINEPGWPTPGEVWAAEPAPMQEETETWSSPDPEDDPLAALTTEPEVVETGWADEAGSFDPTAGWDAGVETPEAEEPVTASWDTPAADDFDWNVAESETEAVTAEEPVAEENSWDVAANDDATWSEPDTTKWDVTAEESQLDEAPVAVATDEAEVQDETPALVWEPVDEVEALEEETAVEVEPAAAVEVEPAAAVEVEPAAAVDEPVVIESEIPVEAVAADWADVEVADEVVEPAVEVVEEAAPAMAVAEIVEMPEMVAEPVVEAPVAETPHEIVEAIPAVPALHVGVADPASKWAAMAPGGQALAPVKDPVSRWANLQPTAPATVAATAAAVVEAHAPAPATAAPSVAWWDVPAAIEVDPRRGRFALGGYALQAGHQVVSGVTFREGVVPPPSHWVIGPVVGEVAPGTLVLNVDGCLNCVPEDLSVLTEPGFAPTTEGFSLRLSALATGPFAASGTYVIS